MRRLLRRLFGGPVKVEKRVKTGIERARLDHLPPRLRAVYEDLGTRAFMAMMEDVREENVGFYERRNLGREEAEGGS